jgi:murein DD-endopeptidase MepM/ murein hydrolase activator NlpD
VAASSRALPTALALLFFAALATPPAPAQLPRINSLDLSDPLYRQHQDGVREYYRAASGGGALPPLLIYSYAPSENDTLFGIAARLAIPYSAVATLNRLDSPVLEEGRLILLPGYPGIFVPVTPESDLEFMIHDLRADAGADVVTLPGSSGGDVFRFLPGADYLPEERRAFLGTLFRPPLENYEITSRYGPRQSPITGAWSFHSGVDFGASTGTPVMAAGSGVVVDTGADVVMGNYVLLRHSGGFATFYGHLDTVLVSLNQEVSSGMILGTVGSSGIATGSHLHFEIRHNGVTRDPMTLLP